MHWQQYVTIGLGAFGALIHIIRLAGNRSTGQAVLGLLIVAAFQALLYSGGWYGY